MNWKALKGKKRSKMNPLSIHMRKGRVAVFWVPGEGTKACPLDRLVVTGEQNKRGVEILIMAPGCTVKWGMWPIL